MLFWKLLTAVDLLILIGYSHACFSGHEKPSRFDFIALPVTLLGTFGLATYAFELPTAPQLLWRVFLPIFVASGAWEIAKALKTDDRNLGSYVGAVAAALLVGFTSIAIYRLGGAARLDVFPN